jgi:hypothetical protein
VGTDGTFTGFSQTVSEEKWETSRLSLGFFKPKEGLNGPPVRFVLEGSVKDVARISSQILIGETLPPSPASSVAKLQK